MGAFNCLLEAETDLHSLSNKATRALYTYHGNITSIQPNESFQLYPQDKKGERFVFEHNR
ncbi:hypothetical protein BELL_0120g00220 [Botrytis elliptica]|uniref:Uncharacterized protein n=1 Tax=Botrytis elliptica TaxID=278938 RepID=A0A4Z1JTM5_9HELO|nr:hypothetical protein BELL_0120g00220 [Botrytis elliptica]